MFYVIMECYQVIPKRVEVIRDEHRIRHRGRVNEFTILTPFSQVRSFHKIRIQFKFSLFDSGFKEICVEAFKEMELGEGDSWGRGEIIWDEVWSTSEEGHKVTGLKLTLDRKSVV